MKNNSMISDLLKKHDLRKTPARLEILKLYADTPHAMSHGDVEQQVDMDRVTIYRTLATFEDKGIIHQAYDGGGVIKYALCHANCSVHSHHDEHLHFSCVQCGNTYCIEGYAIPEVASPKGYTIDNVFLFAKGICSSCN